jgi:signal peptidase I
MTGANVGDVRHVGAGGDDSSTLAGVIVRRRRVDRHPGYPPGRRPTPRSAALVALGALAAAAVVLGRCLGRLEPVRVAGASMAPTLPDGTLVAVGPPPVRFRRGQLVLARRPGHGGAPMELVKRVVGLPGEQVRIGAGGLEVDGRPVAEPYLGGRPAGAPFALRLGVGEYLVLGDARAASTDGRSFGPLEAKNIIAIVRFVYWPPSAWRPSRVIGNLRASAVSSGRRAEMVLESTVDGRNRPRATQ